MLMEAASRAQLLGTAHILASWPWQVARALLCILLGAILGILCAVLLRMLLPLLITPTPEPEHLHLATSNLTAPRACALEALARTHADRPCHVIILSAHPAKSINLIQRLGDNYSNLRAKYHPDPDDYFEDSPLDGFFKLGVSSSLLELAARTLALWRHGGVSVDLDRPVFNLPSSGHHVSHSGLLQFPEPCHPALQGLLATMSTDLNGDADDALNKATNWICRTSKDTTKNKFKPESCLGVSVTGYKDKSKKKEENFFCPIVRAFHDEIKQRKNII